MADGPNGLRTHDTSPATLFPASVAVAATWNSLRAREVGQAIGEEALAEGYRIVLGPAMNIQRVPLGGRNFEYFSEDPCLTGSMAVGWTQGVRSTGRLTTPKHFAANGGRTFNAIAASVQGKRDRGGDARGRRTGNGH